jgi:uncharacterized protein
MINRLCWINQIEDAWKSRSIIWLSGVRRTGKTCLAQSLENVLYFDCELPSVRRMLEDPESFLNQHKGKRIVLDEIHRLGNPSELLKISADHFPSVKVIATGSSTLSASAKFKDTLTGRKTAIHLTPMILEDIWSFKQDVPKRLLNGGLPPFSLQEKVSGDEIQEWVDSYWAKDIQELFRVERRASFMRFFELLMTQSSGIFDATRFSRDCGISHTSIHNYLAIFEETYVATVVRPFSTHKPTEIVAAPKVYGFDTGFVSYYRGWNVLNDDNKGILWEHLVLNELTARLPAKRVLYWRDKQHHEIDFVLQDPDGAVALECKWKAAAFDPANLLIFRNRYPKGLNVVISSDTPKPYQRKFKNVAVEFVGLNDAIERFSTITK